MFKQDIPEYGAPSSTPLVKRTRSYCDTCIPNAKDTGWEKKIFEERQSMDRSGKLNVIIFVKL